MSRDILIDVCGPMTRVALVDSSDIQELYMESPTSEKLVGNIYKGKVQNILPGMQAAFIDIGLNKNAFLYAGDILVDTADFVGMDEKGVEKSLREQPAIRKLLSVGQELLVQVIKEPGGSSLWLRRSRTVVRISWKRQKTATNNSFFRIRTLNERSDFK